MSVARSWPEHLILRSIGDDADVEKYAALHTTVVNQREGTTCDHLMRYHPECSFEDFWIVEDSRTRQVVSTLCLIPWHCRYEEVELKVAMLEMVVTDPNYRHLGLVRALIGRFHEAVSKRNFDLCIIEGIPYYYRQYGYGYAGDHWRIDSLPVWRIPSDEINQSLRLRPATLQDIPQLVELYAQSMSHLHIATLRNADYWRFLLEHEQYPVEMVEDGVSGEIMGYLCILRQGNRQRLQIIEGCIASAEVAMAVLYLLKAETAGEFQIVWAVAKPLLDVARSLGSTPIPGDQWLIRLPDVGNLLSKLAPVLERRIAASAWAGVTTELRLNLFRQAFDLHLIAGKVQQVAQLGFVDASMGADGGDLCIPPEAFVRLLLGYRTLDQLFDAWPDIVVKPERRQLIEVLFPPLSSCFWLPYMYFGS